ncbi:MAG: thiamine-phosphate kinase [Alphaproteobacteria bacterium]|nr:thiamine-phosphate kinase [Alphaproteobacteria bacterium]MBV9693214.1 thiamine-phosphate kinase [Alphaproteobacteria bacterium]
MPILGEFDLIERFFAPLATAPGAFALKDDAAIVAPAPGFDLVVTTDTIVAGIDFFADDPPDAIARKALRVNLSDLAAKGAAPFGYLLALSLPGSDADWLAAFANGLRQDQAQFGCTLYGGDISSTPGPLTVSITAFGQAEAGKMLRRGGACEGDLVFVTGTIGDSGAGLLLLKNATQELDEGFRGFLIGRYRVPEPPVAFGPRLAGLASAALDVSDGLLADLAHLAAASEVHVVVEAERVPLSDAVRALWGDGAVARAVVAGDDYQIAFAAPVEKEDEILQAAAQSGTRATRIGHVQRGMGVAMRDSNGRDLTPLTKGFSHF